MKGPLPRTGGPTPRTLDFEIFQDRPPRSGMIYISIHPSIYLTLFQGEPLV